MKHEPLCWHIQLQLQLQQQDKGVTYVLAWNACGDHPVRHSLLFFPLKSLNLKHSVPFILSTTYKSRIAHSGPSDQTCSATCEPSFDAVCVSLLSAYRVKWRPVVNMKNLVRRATVAEASNIVYPPSSSSMEHRKGTMYLILEDVSPKRSVLL